MLVPTKMLKLLPSATTVSVGAGYAEKPLPAYTPANPHLTRTLPLLTRDRKSNPGTIGKYAASVGSTSCEKCPMGKFAASVGTMSCESCPTPTSGYQEGADRCDYW